MEKSQRLGTLPIKKLLISLSVPSIISLLINAVNVTIDRMFVGTFVGTLGISAVTVCYGIYLLMQGFSQLVATGAASMVAIQLGKKSKVGSQKVAGNTITLSLILTLFITVVGIIFIKPLLSLYGADEVIMPMATEYMRVLFIGSGLFIFAQTLNCLIRGMGFAKIAMIFFFADIITNIGMDALFVIVFKMGVFGAGLATMLSSGICAVLAAIFLVIKNKEVKIKFKDLILDKSITKSILSIGIASAMMQLSISILSLICNRVALSVGGIDCVAVYGIITTIMTMVYMPTIGISQGMQPIVGFNIGANNYSRVKLAFKNALVFGIGFSFVLTALIEIFANYIMYLFGGNGVNIMSTLGVFGLRISCATLPVFTAILMCETYFQSVKKPIFSFVLITLRQIVVIIPLIFILSNYFKMSGLFFSSVISDLSVGIVTVIFIIIELKRLTNLSKNQENDSIVTAC